MGQPGVRARYQACGARQCGQATVVETGARKLKPHSQAYEASSIGPPALRTRSTRRVAEAQASLERAPDRRRRLAPVLIGARTSAFAQGVGEARSHLSMREDSAHWLKVSPCTGDFLGRERPHLATADRAPVARRANGV